MAHDIDERIPVYRPSATDLERQYVAETLDSGWWGYGPRARQLEEHVRDQVGAGEVLACTSGTAALHLALLLADVGPGDEVIVPALTWISTALAVVYTGARPVFADVEEESLGLDLDSVRAAVTPRTRAVIQVHYTGLPGRIDEMQALAREKGLVLIEDAAHAFGAEYRGRRIGGHSDFVCFSMNAVKNAAAGEGGLLAFRDRSLRPRAERLSWLGVSKQTFDISGEGVARRPAVAMEVGFKYRMSDINAAVGLAQAERLDAANAKRRAICRIYADAFRNIAGIRLISDRPEAVSSCHMFAMRVPAAQRDALRAWLGEQGIESSIQYPPLNDEPMFRSPDNAATPRARQAGRELLSLPVFPDLPLEKALMICGAVTSFFAFEAVATEERVTA